MSENTANEASPTAGTDAAANSALDVQVGGGHYKEGGIQPVQYIEANNLGFLEGCVVKRVTRHSRKGGKGRQDIEKSIHELQLLLELRYPTAQQVAERAAAEAERPSYAQENARIAARAVYQFIHRWGDGGTAAERKALYVGFTSEYRACGHDGFQPEHAVRIVDCLKEANGLLARDCRNVRMHYDPKFAPESHGIYLTWDEPKTDSNNEKTNLENKKCQATEAKSEATPEFKAGDAVAWRGGEYFVDRVLRPAVDLRRESDGLVVSMVPATALQSRVTDSPEPTPPAADPEAEATRHPSWPQFTAAYNKFLREGDPTATAVEVGDRRQYLNAMAREAGVRKLSVVDPGARAGWMVHMEQADALIRQGRTLGLPHRSSVFPEVFRYPTVVVPEPAPPSAGPEPAPPSAGPEAEATAVKPFDQVMWRGGEFIVDRVLRPEGQAHTALLYPVNPPVSGDSATALLSELTLVDAETDSPEPTPPAADPEAEADAQAESALTKYLQAATLLAVATKHRFVGVHPALGAGYRPGDGGVVGFSAHAPRFYLGGRVDQGPSAPAKGEATAVLRKGEAFVGGDDVESLWRDLGRGTLVTVAAGVEPYTGYGHGVVKDIVSCTQTTGESTRKIVKAVVEFPPTSLPDGARLPQTYTIRVDDLRVTFVRRGYRKP